jgi:hypothetical protein
MDMSSKYDGRKDAPDANESSRGQEEEVSRLKATVAAQNAEIKSLERRSQESVAAKNAEIKSLERRSQETIDAKDVDREMRQRDDDEKATLRQQLATTERELTASLEDRVKKQDDEIVALRGELHEAMTWNSNVVNSDKEREVRLIGSRYGLSPPLHHRLAVRARSISPG